MNKILGEPYFDNYIRSIWTSDPMTADRIVILTPVQKSDVVSHTIFELNYPKVFFSSKDLISPSPASIETVINFYNHFAVQVERIFLDSMGPMTQNSSDWFKTSRKNKLEFIGLPDYAGDLAELFKAWRELPNRRKNEK